MRRRVVIVGGGIAGLAAAHALVSAPDAPEVTLLDASARVGGRITTVPFGGVDLDVGPDALLSRAPGATALCRELGLGDDLMPCADGGAFVWSRGALRPLPAGLLAGLPAGPGRAPALPDPLARGARPREPRPRPPAQRPATATRRSASSCAGASGARSSTGSSTRSSAGSTRATATT